MTDPQADAAALADLESTGTAYSISRFGGGWEVTLDIGMIPGDLPEGFGETLTEAVDRAIAAWKERLADDGE